MNIVVLGAGAIGSLFGGLLSQKNTVVLVGRTPHITAIKNLGLTITGKTLLTVHVSAEDSIDNVNIQPDVILITVKSYDTEKAIQEAASLITKKTIVISLQNGLDNIEKIKKTVDTKNILGGVTTHGAVLVKPGLIRHTGVGQTILGELTGENTNRLTDLVSLCNESGIETIKTTNFLRELWIKTIINSSINPLTALFFCKNGYLLENPILENVMNQICKESTAVALSEKIAVTYEEMAEKTKEVVRLTAENYSSMLQSVQRETKTEIDSINGAILQMGKKQGVDVSLNEILVYLMQSLHKTG